MTNYAGPRLNLSKNFHAYMFVDFGRCGFCTEVHTILLVIYRILDVSVLNIDSDSELHV